MGNKYLIKPLTMRERTDHNGHLIIRKPPFEEISRTAFKFSSQITITVALNTHTHKQVI